MKKMIERVLYNEIVIAIIIKRNYVEEGINFLTPNSFSLQLGYMNRPADYIIEPHVHKLGHREIDKTQEVLFIKSGKVLIDFYNEDKFFLESKVVEEGDVIFLASGGHGFKMLENSEIIEVKQGPYVNENLDKSKF